MGVTFRRNGVAVGALVGVLVGLASKNVALGVVAGIAAGVAAWYGIAALETLLGRGIDAGFSAASNWNKRRGPNGGRTGQGAPYLPPPQGPGAPYPPPQGPGAQYPPPEARDLGNGRR